MFFFPSNHVLCHSPIIFVCLFVCSFLQSCFFPNEYSSMVPRGREDKMIESILKKYGHLGVQAPAGWALGGASTPAPAAPAATGFGQVCRIDGVCILYPIVVLVYLELGEFVRHRTVGFFLFYALEYCFFFLILSSLLFFSLASLFSFLFSLFSCLSSLFLIFPPYLFLLLFFSFVLFPFIFSFSFLFRSSSWFLLCSLVWNGSIAPSSR